MAEPVALDFSKAQPIQQSGVKLDFSKAQPLQSLSPPTGARGEVGNIKPPTAAMNQEDALGNPQTEEEGKRTFLAGMPGAWMNRPVTGKDLVPGAIAGGAAAAVAAPTAIAPVAAWGARQAVKHPIVTATLASEGIRQARKLPVVGRFIPPYSEMLPYLLSHGEAEEEPEAPSAPIPTPRNFKGPIETEAPAEVTPPPLRGFKGPIETEPATSSTAPTSDPILERLRANAAKIQEKGHGESPVQEDESRPLRANEELTPVLKKSLARVKAAKKNGGKTESPE